MVRTDGVRFGSTIAVALNQLDAADRPIRRQTVEQWVQAANREDGFARQHVEAQSAFVRLADTGQEVAIIRTVNRFHNQNTDSSNANTPDAPVLALDQYFLKRIHGRKPQNVTRQTGIERALLESENLQAVFSSDKPVLYIANAEDHDHAVGDNPINKISIANRLGIDEEDPFCNSRVGALITKIKRVVLADSLNTYGKNWPMILHLPLVIDPKKEEQLHRILDGAIQEGIKINLPELNNFLQYAGRLEGRKSMTRDRYPENAFNYGWEAGHTPGSTSFAPKFFDLAVQRYREELAHYTGLLISPPETADRLEQIEIEQAKAIRKKLLLDILGSVKRLVVDYKPEYFQDGGTPVTIPYELRLETAKSLCRLIKPYLSQVRDEVPQQLLSYDISGNGRVLVNLLSGCADE